MFGLIVLSYVVYVAAMGRLPLYIALFGSGKSTGTTTIADYVKK